MSFKDFLNESKTVGIKFFDTLDDFLYRELDKEFPKGQADWDGE